jgi:hypothetical protein
MTVAERMETVGIEKEGKKCLTNAEECVVEKHEGQ